MASHLVIDAACVSFFYTVKLKSSGETSEFFYCKADGAILQGAILITVAIVLAEFRGPPPFFPLNRSLDVFKSSDMLLTKIRLSSFYVQLCHCCSIRKELPYLATH